MNTRNDPASVIAAERAAGALSVRTDPPFRWASGAMMPVYNDNRRLLATPEGRITVRRGLTLLATEHGIMCDAIAGTASAGIAPATLLAEELQLPLYYVRAETKEHGRGRRIEGAPDDGIAGARVLLVEDLISTGGSSVAAARALIDEGATVVACVAIFSYGFERAIERFRELPGSPPVFTLATVDDLIDDAASGGWLSPSDIALLREWHADPFGWWDRRSGADGEEATATRAAISTEPTPTSAPAVADTPAPSPAVTPTVRPTPHPAGDRVRERLRATAEAAGHLLCVGLDPRPELLPEGIGVADFLQEVLGAIAATGIPPAAFKPNVAFFHQLDRPHDDEFRGSRALASTIQTIRREFPGVPVILDAKRGDIATTSAAYASEAFTSWEADAVTISPLMGDDSVGPFLETAQAQEGRWSYILNRTSNPGARRFQNRRCAGDDTTTEEPRVEPLYETIAAAIQEWQRRYGTAGAVIGATAPAELQRLIEIHQPEPIPILIPGVGAQGADAVSVVGIVRAAAYPLELVRINASRRVVFPWADEGSAPSDWTGAIRDSYLRTTEETAW